MEPQYTYKRGVGWTLGYPENYRVIGDYGILIEHRKPEIGERFYYLNSIGSNMLIDGPNYESLFQYLTDGLIARPPDFNTAVYDGSEQSRRTYMFNTPDFYTHVTLTITRIT